MSTRYPKANEWWRRPGRLSLDEAQRGYDYFRIIDWGLAAPLTSRSVHHPRIPRNLHKGEDATIPRVCLAPTIRAAIGAYSGADGDPFGWPQEGWYVYGAKGVPVEKNICQHVPDADATGEVWSLTPIEMDCIGTIGGGRSSPRGRRWHLWINTLRGRP